MNKKNWIRELFVLILSLALALSAGCGKPSKEQEQEPTVALELSQMQNVCELATLECYYHNTAKFDSQKRVLFWNTSKRLWIEYSGIVKVGVDIGGLDMKVKDNLVTVTLPQAKVMSCNVDEKSLTDESFYAETSGLGSGKITAQDQSEAFQAAQDGMLKAAQEDELLLHQARERARLLIENYVKNVGEAVGVEYQIQWELSSAEETEG